MAQSYSWTESLRPQRLLGPCLYVLISQDTGTRPVMACCDPGGLGPQVPFT